MVALLDRLASGVEWLWAAYKEGLGDAFRCALPFWWTALAAGLSCAVLDGLMPDVGATWSMFAVVCAIIGPLIFRFSRDEREAV